MNDPDRFDFVVIGGGPAGQAAAMEAANAGKRVLLVDMGRGPGGECVRHGTIPSKALHEAASAASRARRSTAELFRVSPPQEVPLDGLMTRVRDVISAYEASATRQIDAAHVEYACGKGTFLGPNRLQIRAPGAPTRIVEMDTALIATGSRPRVPTDMVVDHENIVDSDSILSLQYLPESLVVLGGGVIACEYASIFAHLGVKVTIIDRGQLPLGFLDPELSQRFLDIFEAHGGRFCGETSTKSVVVDDFASVRTELDDGETLKSEKVLFALGRVANLKGLGLETIGVETTPRGIIPVNEHFETNVPGILAVGDVIGPPSLAASAFEQGRRAVIKALKLEEPRGSTLIPIGIYTLPEVSTVGTGESKAREELGDVVVGRAEFSEIARAHIAGAHSGFLKLIADGTGSRLLGVEIVGEGATDLIHMGQMALAEELDIDVFVNRVFNFPTLAEAYRIAALDIVRQREQAPVPG